MSTHADLVHHTVQWSSGQTLTIDDVSLAAADIYKTKQLLSCFLSLPVNFLHRPSSPIDKNLQRTSSTLNLYFSKIRKHTQAQKDKNCKALSRQKVEYSSEKETREEKWGLKASMHSSQKTKQRRQGTDVFKAGAQPCVDQSCEPQRACLKRKRLWTWGM